MGRLAGKVVVIIGASRGIGLAIAHGLGRDGANLALIGRDRQALRRAAAQVPGDALPLVADVTHPGQVRRVFSLIRRRYRHIDVLVNSAGFFTYKPFARTTLRDWRANIEGNLTALFLTIRAALPLLERSRAAQVVNILSISSRQAFPNCSAYSASKFGALGLTQVLREELRARGIRVTAILPGSTDTRLVKAFDFPVDRSKLVQPQDVAQAVLGALLQPVRATVEEIILLPSCGRL